MMKAFKSPLLIFAVLFVAGVSLTLVGEACATITISDDGGDCYQVGKWKTNSRICTLDTYVSVSDNDGIDIDGNGVRLLCKGHSIMVNGTGNGILFFPEEQMSK